MDFQKIKDFLIDRMEILAFILFVLAIFLADVNLNMIMAYGMDVQVTIFGSHKVLSTSAFWFGFIFQLLIFSLIAFRSLYERKKKLGVFDVIFGVIGVIGLMITLSGGLLAFYHDSSLIIPFFKYKITRVSYYHIGIGLDILSLFYFALTKTWKR